MWCHRKCLRFTSCLSQAFPLAVVTNSSISVTLSVCPGCPSACWDTHHSELTEKMEDFTRQSFTDMNQPTLWWSIDLLILHFFFIEAANSHIKEFWNLCSEQTINNQNDWWLMFLSVDFRSLIFEQNVSFTIYLCRKPETSRTWNQWLLKELIDYKNSYWLIFNQFNQFILSSFRTLFVHVDLKVELGCSSGWRVCLLCFRVNSWLSGDSCCSDWSVGGCKHFLLFWLVGLWLQTLPVVLWLVCRWL